MLVEEANVGDDADNCITAAELAEPADRMCQRYMQLKAAASAPKKRRQQQPSMPPQSLAAVKARMGQLSPIDMSPRMSSPKNTC